MRIDDYRAAQIAQGYGLNQAGDAAARAKKPAERTDEASLSPEAQTLLKARRVVAEAPEVRAELVAQLRRQLEDGTYRVDEHALARRLAGVLDVEA